VPLNAITQANALGITQSHFGCIIKQGDEWERFASAHKDVSMIKMSMRVNPSWPTSIYRAPNKAPLAVVPMKGHRTELWTQKSRPLDHALWVRCHPMTIAHAPRVLAFEFNCCRASTAPCRASDYASDPVAGPTAPRVQRCLVSSRELKTTPDLIRPIPLDQASLSLEHFAFSLSCYNYLCNL
jgi:hypothetical protein